MFIRDKNFVHFCCVLISGLNVAEYSTLSHSDCKKKND